MTATLQRKAVGSVIHLGDRWGIVTGQGDGWLDVLWIKGEPDRVTYEVAGWWDKDG